MLTKIKMVTATKIFSVA